MYAFGCSCVHMREMPVHMCESTGVCGGYSFKGLWLEVLVESASVSIHLLSSV